MPDPAGIVLPRGFQYRILQQGGSNTPDDVATNYDDGQKLAGDADGAASFAIGGGRTVIVANHEVRAGDELDEAVPQTFDGRAVPTYNPASAGGTTNIVFGPKNRVLSIYPSLAGTRNNCAGGLTPWGTWLTCEENTDQIEGVQHGYVFEVDPTGEKTSAVPCKAMGRMAHEAVAIDPATSIAYETEDDEGFVYRFLPSDTSQAYGSLGKGGTLQAMKVDGLHRLGEVRTVGTPLPVTWLNVPGDDADIPEGHPMFDGPDNICIAPWGTAFLCEDGGGDQYLVGVDPASGDLWPFAFNRTGDNEFAGANFSPDGKTLFVNIQNPSTTVAITGPWGAMRRGA